MDAATTTNLQGLADFFRAQYTGSGNEQVGATTVAPALDEAQLREYLQILADFNTGMVARGNELGATAISLPDVQSESDLGSLSTADLLQLLRIEQRKTTAALIETTRESIEAQRATIESNKTATAKELDTVKEATLKAERLQAIMDVVKWAVVGLGVIMAIATGGVAGAAMLAIMGAMLLMTEVKVNDDDQSIMDLATEGISKGLQSLGMDEEEADLAAMGILIALQIILTVGVGYYAAAGAAQNAAMGAAAGVGKGAAQAAAQTVDDVAAAAANTAANAAKAAADDALQVAASSADDAATAAVDAAEEIAEEAIEQAVIKAANSADDAVASAAKAAGGATDEVAGTAGNAAADTAESTARWDAAVVNKFAKWDAAIRPYMPGIGGGRLESAVRLTDGAVQVAQGGTQIAAGLAQYESAMASAEVESLKAMLQYLQSLMDADAEFVQQIFEMQTMLDATVDGQIALEFQGNTSRQSEMFG